MLVDYFPYFNERELLELRIRLLQDHVDHFVIVEADQTFSGLPRQFEVKQLIQALALPQDRITVIEWHHADPVNLQLEQQDLLAMYPEDRGDLASIQAVARERIQRNALLTVLDQFDEDAWILMSDCDEIINPAHLGFARHVAEGNSGSIIKLPLINLYGRADLRPYSQAGWPYTWRTAMSICRADIVAQTTPHRIRCGYHLPVEILTPTLNGEIFDEFGWHFSWMGGAGKIAIKSESYAHAPNQGHQLHRDQGFRFEENVSLTWNPDSVLKRFPQDQLPGLIFDLPHVRDFLLPDRI
jgi:hypothetical protein